MEYKRVQYWYNTIKEAIKEIGKSLCYNFISGELHTGDGFTDKKNHIKTKWDHRHSYKKISGETKETIDNKL